MDHQIIDVEVTEDDDLEIPPQYYEHMVYFFLHIPCFKSKGNFYFILIFRYKFFIIY